jgi:hypothetical protein
MAQSAAQVGFNNLMPAVVYASYLTIHAYSFK